MSVPASRKSRSSVRRRRSHDHASAKQLGECPKCKSAIKQHHACVSCGAYNGRDSVDTNKKTSRTLKQMQSKAASKKPAEETPKS